MHTLNKPPYVAMQGTTVVEAHLFPVAADERNFVVLFIDQAQDLLNGLLEGSL